MPRFPTNPFKLGFEYKWLFVQQLPGFLPELESNSLKNSHYDFSLVTYLNRSLVDIRNERTDATFNDEDDVISGMAIMHNFAYLNSLAAVHGFTPYDELTYPFVNQSVITDGQHWSFHVYQLNTHSFHNDVNQSLNCNLCWSTKERKLYEKYEDGQFVGVNKEVVRNLITVNTKIKQ